MEYLYYYIIAGFFMINIMVIADYCIQRPKFSEVGNFDYSDLIVCFLLLFLGFFLHIAIVATNIYNKIKDR